uniref:Centromere protein J n=1 Tax=Salarias fasciatus TaxID=181472 RepID=A0A672H3G0_SALFA
MQEQLKAHQLEELLRLQEEQQRLLINGNGSQHRKEDAAESSETSEPEWVEDTLHGTQQAEELSSAERQRQLSTVQGAAEEEDLWNSGDDPETVKAVFHPLTQHDKSVETLNEVLHDRPIKPGIGVQKRTFEELLEEQLRLEEQRLQVSKQQTREGAEAVQAAPKRTFLKRGEGLARFTKNTKGSSQTTEKGPKPQPQARVISRSNSEPTSILTVNAQNVPRLPVQRKTAILNKENRPRGLSVPPADSRTARTKVLGGRQQQNTCGPESSRTDSEGKTRKPLPGQNRKTVGPVRSLAQITQPNPVTKQVGVLESQGKAAGSDAARNRSLGSKVTKNRENPVEEENMPSDCFELSFQERIQRWECDRQQESMDLGEFELLEQAAEELSFSSNSSFVVKVLYSLSEQTRPDELKRGISCDDKDEQNREKDDRQQLSDISSCCGSESGDEEAAVGFPAQANPPYDKRSYQDEDVFRDPAPDEEEEESNDSTLMEDEDGGSGRVVFDDDDTWNDLEDTAIGPDQDVREDPPVSPPEKLLVRKVAASRGAELHQEAGGLEPDLPPASQLMSRLFPALKPKPQKAPPPPPPAVTSADKTRAEDPGQQAQSLQLRERLAELEIEIERFKKENSALTKLRQENEKIQENLRRERAEFEQTKAEEAAKFEEYKKEENKKLQKERKLFETHVLATRALPDRKEREEMQALKQQLNSAQEELKRREARWTSTHSRLRQQIDSLSQENSALRDEVRMLEKLRLSAWKKTPAATERESPRVFENTVSAVTKGVTFAVSVSCVHLYRICVHLKGKVSLHMNPELWFFSWQVEKVLASGDRVIVFPNGTRKEVSADGESVKVTFFNGDTKQITADQRVTYYYAEAQTTHITYPDGLEVLHFPNNQTEKHFPDGRKEITFPDQTVKNLFPDGREESVLTDGTIIQVNPDGTKEIHFNTGQKEIHTADYKRRQYPDGTVKTVYTDGRQETRYPTGRVRIKDQDGNVVLDQMA